MDPVRTTERNFRMRWLADASVVLCICIAIPQNAGFAAPASADDTVRGLTLKLNDPALSAKEKSKIYLQRANAYLISTTLLHDDCDKYDPVDENRRKAIEDLNSAVQSDSTNAEAYIVRGEQSYCAARQRDGEDKAKLQIDIDRAVADYTTALRIGLPNEKKSEVYYKRAMTETSNEASLQDFNAAIQADDRNGDIVFARGMFFQRRGVEMNSDEMREKAIADFTTALLLPLHKDRICAVYSRRAFAYDAMKEYDLAIKDLTTLISIGEKAGDICWASYYGLPNGLGYDIDNLRYEYLARAQVYDHMGKRDKADADRRAGGQDGFNSENDGGYDNPPHGAY